MFGFFKINNCSWPKISYLKKSMADRMVNLLTTLLAYIKNKSLMTVSSSYWLWDWVFFLLINYLKLYLILAEGVINTQNVQKISVCKTTYQNCQWCFIST